MNSSLPIPSPTSASVLALTVIVFVTLFRDAVRGGLHTLEETGAGIGRLFLAGSTWALSVIGSDQEFASSTAQGTVVRTPDVARRLLGAVLASVFFLAMYAVDWASLTLALQGMLGTTESSVMPAQWILLLDKSLALAILLPGVYSAWHLSELLGWTHLLSTAQTTPVWRRVQLWVAVIAFALSLTCGVAVAVYRALSLVSSVEPALVSPVTLAASLTPLTLTTMVTMILSLMSCAALAFEAGLTSLLRLLPLLTLVLTHGVLWFVARMWGGLFALLNETHGILTRFGTALLRFPHSALIVANRWALYATGPWRWLGVPVALITSFVHDVDLEADPRLAALSPSESLGTISTSSSHGAARAPSTITPNATTTNGPAVATDGGSGNMRTAA